MLAKVPLNDIKESIKHNLDENINWGCGVYNGIFEL